MDKIKARSKKGEQKHTIVVDPLTIAFSKIIEGAKQRVRKTDIPDAYQLAEAVRSELKKGDKVERRRTSDKLKAVPVEMITDSLVEPIGVAEAREAAQATEAPAPAKGEARKGESVAHPELRGTSTAMKPTRLVWSIADKMAARKGGATRAQVLAECQKKGITYYTARTQYQLWKADKEGK